MLAALALSPALLLAPSPALASTPVSGAGVEPVLIAGNPDCEELGYLGGFKVEGEADWNGTYALTSTDGTLTGGAIADATNSITVENATDNVFDWAATLGIDAVIVKAGNEANSYLYEIPLDSPYYDGDPGEELMSDTGLGTPDVQAISHIEFCYDYEFDPLKTADAEYFREITWTIDKTAGADTSGFIGDTTLPSWEVSVDKTVTDFGAMVSGEITIFHNHPTEVVDVSVIDTISTADGDFAAAVDCGDGSAEAMVGPGETLICTYQADLPSPSDGINVATITSGSPFVGSGTAEADVIFGEPTLTDGSFETVHVDDTNGMSWTASDDTTWSYDTEELCATDFEYIDGVYTFSVDNTATVAEDETLVAEASQNVTCYAPVVSKTGDPSFTRTFNWEIDKQSDADYAEFIGDTVDHPYAIEVGYTPSDSDWAVAGQITIHNPNPDAEMTLTSVTDDLSGIDIGVTCPTLVVPTGGNLVCDYAADLPDGSSRTNVATAAFNGLSFDSNSVGIAFTEPTDLVDAEVTVTDTNPNQGPWTFHYTDLDFDRDYSITYACSDLVGDYAGDGQADRITEVNTATLFLEDGSVGGSDTATVNLDCYAPLVAKTGEGSFIRERVWEVTKGDDGHYDRFIGESATHPYVVGVSADTVDRDWEVDGTITVSNPHPTDAIALSAVTDVVGGVAANVTCDTLDVLAGGSIVCAYDAQVADDTVAVENIATVDFNGFSFDSNVVPIEFTPSPLNETVTVTDSNPEQGPWTFTYGDDDLDRDYALAFDCSTNVEDYAGDGQAETIVNVNTATLVLEDGSTGGQDSATVTVDCYAPIVSKTADTDYNIDYSWLITKSVSPDSHTGFPGDAFISGYEVSVDGTVQESEFAVSGSISVLNPHPSASMTVALADSVAGTPASLDCGGSLNIGAASEGSCGYSADIAEKTDGTNTATATFNGFEFAGVANYAFGDPTSETCNGDIVDGFEQMSCASIFVTDSQPDSPAPWSTNEDTTWTYAGDFACPTDEAMYEGGVYTTTVPNTAKIVQTRQEADADVDVNCYLPANAEVVKYTSEGPDDIGQFPFTFELFAPGDDVNPVETVVLAAAGTIAFDTSIETEGTWKVVEVLPEGWVSETSLECAFDVAFPAAADATFGCTFDNTEMGRVSVLKLTDGVMDDTYNWTFRLYEGPDGFEGVELASFTTPPSEWTFDVDLDPYQTYTLCETEVPAGWTSEWMIDTDGDDAVDTALIAYNPNADDEVPADVGNRCFDFGADTSYPVPVGDTLAFQVDNQFPGGAARTPGYWKNWNFCSTGNQSDTATKNAEDLDGNGIVEGWERVASGWALLDDILNDPGVTWGSFTIDSCEDGVSILDQRNIATGKKSASDGAYTLAMHLLAAELNFASGAATCQEAQDAAVDAEALLVSIGFDGTGKYLRPKMAEYSDALYLAALLDAYNNNELCDGQN